MDRSDVVTLYADSISYDAYGVAKKTRTAKDVFCNVSYVSRNEFFEGGRSGLNPEFRITMFFGDYNGEQVVGYKGRLYSVYRVYQGKTDTIELYVERQGGTNGYEEDASGQT